MNNIENVRIIIYARLSKIDIEHIKLREKRFLYLYYLSKILSISLIRKYRIRIITQRFYKKIVFIKTVVFYQKKLNIIFL